MGFGDSRHHNVVKKNISKMVSEFTIDAAYAGKMNNKKDESIKDDHSFMLRRQ